MIGHEEQVAALKAAFTGDRPHHAWLLVGPQGLGKALFAREAATWLLAGLPEARGFAVDPEDKAAQLVGAGSHLDLRVVTREANAKTGNMRGEIVMGQIVRRDDTVGQPLREFLQGTPMLGRRRVVIVDAADDMNRSVANALLKNLEEPSEDTTFFLISHSPGRLLPTIRSRCRTLRFRMLPESDVRAVLRAEVPDLDEEDRDTAVRIANGCPGRAVRLAEPGIGKLEAELAALAATPAAQAATRAQALARSVAGKANAARYEALLERAPAFLAEAARQRSGPALARTLADWEAAAKLAGEAVPLSLDPAQVAFDLACRVARLAEA